MATVTIDEAETQLSNLVARAESGEEILIAREGVAVAKITALAPRRSRPVFGALAGKMNIPDSFFFEEMSEEELRSWEDQ